VFDALAHPTRREILRYLRTRDYVRAGALGDALGVVPSTLSGHLRVLRDAGLVESRRRGTEIQYRVQLTLLDEAILLLQGLRSGTGDDEQSRTSGRTGGVGHAPTASRTTGGGDASAEGPSTEPSGGSSAASVVAASAATATERRAEQPPADVGPGEATTTQGEP
jgi:DNA-binding transcriptional ArsR family regulator